MTNLSLNGKWRMSGGGNVLIRVYNSLPNEEIDYNSDVTVDLAMTLAEKML